MQFHKEISNYFKSNKFNQNKRTVFIIIILILFIIGQVINISEFNILQKTETVVVASTYIFANEEVTKDKLKPYNITLKEFNRQLLDYKNGIRRGRLIKWDEIDNYIGCFHGFSKGENDFIYSDQIMPAKQDYSRQALRSNPGKNIIELDVSSSNLGTFKKILQVGDKINIGCTYEAQYNTNVSLQELNSNYIRKNNLEVETIVTLDLFSGVKIADILNSQGDSLLDYFTYINTLNQSEKYRIQQTDEYEKMTRVQNLLLAVTPEEERLYREYKEKKGVKFTISLPQLDE